MVNYKNWSPYPQSTICPCGSFEFELKVIDDSSAKPAILYYLVLECVRCGSQYIVGPDNDRLVIQPFNNKALKLKKIYKKSNNIKK